MVTRRRRFGWRLPLLGSLLVFLVVVFAQRTQITDWVRLYGYAPTGELTSLTSDDGFTTAANHLFLINRPQISEKTTFSGKCSSEVEQTIVLGCYHGVQNGIFVLRIASDERLHGVMQVTAAHEMLHAAYDRLPKAKRIQVDAWLMDYYQHGLTDERIKTTIDGYKTSEPDAVVNEMHSIFGTEVANLPANLEDYYSKYFTSRQQVAQYASGYQAEFVSRQNQVKSYDAQLGVLKSHIDSDEAQLTRDAASLKESASQLDALRQNGQYAAYNAGVEGYNNKINAYNGLVNATKDLIAKYNKLVDARNEVALQQRQLVNELSGNDLSTINKQ